MNWSVNLFSKSYVEQSFFDAKEFEVVSVKTPYESDPDDIAGVVEVAIVKDGTKYPLKKDGTPYESNLYEKFTVKARGTSLEELKKLEGQLVDLEVEDTNLYTNKKGVIVLVVMGKVRKVAK